MPILAALVLIAAPVAADDPAPHSGVVKVSHGPELSDIALFVFAVAGVALARHAMRKRRKD